MSDYIGLPRVKTAALGAITGAITAHREREKLREMGLTEEQIDNALTRTGAFMRGLQRDIPSALLGGGLGAIGVSTDKLPDHNATLYGSALLGMVPSAFHTAVDEKERAQAAATRADTDTLMQLTLMDYLNRAQAPVGKSKKRK
jgi:hypothetical protein